MSSASLADALQALGAGASGRAEAAARAALAQSPREPAWLAVLAIALSQQQRAADALPAFQALVELQPHDATHWTNLGNCLCELGREVEALQPLQRAFALGDRSPALHFALARALAAAADPRPALQHVDAALRADPQHPELHLLRARILVALDDTDGAARQVAGLRDPRLPAALRVDAAHLLVQLTLYADAQATFDSVLAAQPDHVEAMIGLATVHERCNRLDDACALRERIEPYAAGLTPLVATALRQLDARLASRRRDHARARAELETVLADPPGDPALRCNLWFELGRACDALDDPPAAMRAFATAHADRRAQVTSAHPALTRSDGLLAVLDAEVPPFAPGQRAGTDDGRRDPLFVVGFPRSGTTLLEQLLDAHEALASFDEQPFVQRLITRLNTRAPGYPDVLPHIDGALRAELRRQYYADVDRVLPALGARRPVDKNPLYIARLPLIAATFPDAQVLLALRHPCDVVLSCHMQNFRAPAFAVTFETLATTARMYDQVMRQYHGFRDRLGLPTHVIRYEDLVADLPARAQALFAFLDLPWSDELLRFTERAAKRGAISTPSYTQVTQPVHRNAVGRWDRYRPWFTGEVMAYLAPWCERFGYGV